MKAACRMFRQILKRMPHHDFARSAQEPAAEGRRQGLSSWRQFVAMLCCQLDRAQALRESDGG